MTTKLTATQQFIRESVGVSGHGVAYTESGRAQRYAEEAKHSAKRRKEASRLRRVRGVARDARTLESMAAGSAHKRAIRQEAFTGRKIEASSVAEMAAIYRSRFVAAYASSGVVPNLGALFMRRKVVVRLVVSPAVAKTRYKYDLAAIMAQADKWEAEQVAREAAGDKRQRGKKINVVVGRVEGPGEAGAEAGALNPYSARVRFAWVRAVWRAAKGSIAEAYRGHRDIDRTVSSDELRALRARFGDEAAASAEKEEMERVALLNEDTTAQAVETWSDNDKGARRLDVRRELEHAKRCVLAFHLSDKGGQRWDTDIEKDMARLASLVRILRGESYAVLGSWVGTFNNSAKKKEFERFQKRLGAGDLILSGAGADKAEESIALYLATIAKGRRRAPLTFAVDGNGNLTSDKLTVQSAIASAEGYRAPGCIVRGTLREERAAQAQEAAQRAKEAARRAKRCAVVVGRVDLRPAAPVVEAAPVVVGLLPWSDEAAAVSADKRRREARRNHASYRQAFMPSGAVIPLPCSDVEASIVRARRARRSGDGTRAEFKAATRRAMGDEAAAGRRVRWSIANSGLTVAMVDRRGR